MLFSIHATILLLFYAYINLNTMKNLVKKGPYLIEIDVFFVREQRSVQKQFVAYRPSIFVCE